MRSCLRPSVSVQRGRGVRASCFCLNVLTGETGAGKSIVLDAEEIIVRSRSAAEGQIADLVGWVEGTKPNTSLYLAIYLKLTVKP